MHHLVLASDYDGTLAENGIVEPETLSALRRFRRSGRHIVLVTGRELPDLMQIFPQYELFRLIVGENGALLYDPTTQEEVLLCEAPPAEFTRRLRERGVTPLSVGRVIVDTMANQRETVLKTVQELGLDLHLIFNKGSLMILPSGVNKASGIRAALQRLGLSPRNAVAVGDGENDVPLLSACGFGVSVANGVPVLQAEADWVTSRPAGGGVVELIQRILHYELKPSGEMEHQMIMPIE